MADIDLPVTFRAEIIFPVLETVKAGESCSLLGVGSVGKSNVARHLARADVRDHHLGSAAACVLGVYVDCQGIGDCSAIRIDRLLLQSLSRAIPQASNASAANLAESIKARWMQSEHTAAEPLVRDSLEVAIRGVLSSGIDRLYFILDDFDPILMRASRDTLNGLRSLRDQFKPQLTYVAVTRREWHELRKPTSDYKDLYELVTATTKAIGPCTMEDSLFAIRRLLKRWDMPALSDLEQRNLLVLSGHHPGLLKAILWAVHQDAALKLASPGIQIQLHNHKDVAPELRNIVESLGPDELADLEALAQQSRMENRAVRALEGKGLIQAQLDGTHVFFSPLFKAHILRRIGTRPATPGLTATPAQSTVFPQVPLRVLELDAVQRTVKRDGQLVPLDVVEFKLVETLYARRGQPVTRLELRDVMLAAEINLPRPALSVTAAQRLATYMAGLIGKINTFTLAIISPSSDGAGYILQERGQERGQ